MHSYSCLGNQLYVIKFTKSTLFIRLNVTEWLLLHWYKNRKFQVYFSTEFIPDVGFHALENMDASTESGTWVLWELSMSQYFWPYLQCICQQDRKDTDIRNTLFICKFVSQVEKQTGAVLKRQETIHCWEVLWKKNLRSKLELMFSVAC